MQADLDRLGRRVGPADHRLAATQLARGVERGARLGLDAEPAAGVGGDLDRRVLVVAPDGDGRAGGGRAAGVDHGADDGLAPRRGQVEIELRGLVGRDRDLAAGLALAGARGQPQVARGQPVDAVAPAAHGDQQLAPAVAALRAVVAQRERTVGHAGDRAGQRTAGQGHLDAVAGHRHPLATRAAGGDHAHLVLAGRHREHRERPGVVGHLLLALGAGRQRVDLDVGAGRGRAVGEGDHAVEVGRDVGDLEHHAVDARARATVEGLAGGRRRHPRPAAQGHPPVDGRRPAEAAVGLDVAGQPEVLRAGLAAIDAAAGHRHAVGREDDAGDGAGRAQGQVDRRWRVDGDVDRGAALGDGAGDLAGGLERVLAGGDLEPVAAVGVGQADVAALSRAEAVEAVGADHRAGDRATRLVDDPAGDLACRDHLDVEAVGVVAELELGGERRRDLDLVPRRRGRQVVAPGANDRQHRRAVRRHPVAAGHQLDLVAALRVGHGRRQAPGAGERDLDVADGDRAAALARAHGAGDQDQPVDPAHAVGGDAARPAAIEAPRARLGALAARALGRRGLAGRGASMVAGGGGAASAEQEEEDEGATVGRAKDHEVARGATGTVTAAAAPPADPGESRTCAGPPPGRRVHGHTRSRVLGRFLRRHAHLRWRPATHAPRLPTDAPRGRAGASAPGLRRAPALAMIGGDE